MKVSFHLRGRENAQATRCESLVVSVLEASNGEEEGCLNSPRMRAAAQLGALLHLRLEWLCWPWSCCAVHRCTPLLWADGRDRFL